jgi:tetratricopeptide (TPR) repeat protein
MIRRDYFLRMIEEFAQALARIRSLKRGQRWREASTNLDAEFERLLGEGAQAVARRSESELLSRLMQDGPTHLVRDKTFMLTTLLKEAGDVAAAEERVDESRECHLKALHLLLDVLARGEVFDCPEFVPKVEMLKEALQGSPLPQRTHAMLMQHHERTGEYAKAENALFAMLDAEPDNGDIVEFGLAFYNRMLAQSDMALTEGALPRAEVEEGKELLQRPRRSEAPNAQ